MITLTTFQKKLIDRYLRGEFNQFTATEEEQQAFSEIIDDMEELLDKENAYEEVLDKFNGDNIKWYIWKQKSAK